MSSEALLLQAFKHSQGTLQRVNVTTSGSASSAADLELMSLELVLLHKSLVSKKRLLHFIGILEPQSATAATLGDCQCEF